MTAPRYTLAELVPHAGPMRLLDEVRAVSEETVEALAHARRDGIFAEPGRPGIPAWVGLEYLAQAIAAWSGHHELEAGRPVRPGLLVGSRAFRSSVGRIPFDVPLTISATRLYADPDGINVFEGRVSGEGVEQSTRIKVFLPRDLAAHLEEPDDD